MPGEITDWTVYTNRRRLIRVLRYVVGQGMVTVTAGTDDLFMDDVSGEVLYENTGASKYFMSNFTKDIMHYTCAADFMESEWYEVDEDRGFARRHRVYKLSLIHICRGKPVRRFSPAGSTPCDLHDRRHV